MMTVARQPVVLSDRTKRITPSPKLVTAVKTASRGVEFTGETGEKMQSGQVEFGRGTGVGRTMAGREVRNATGRAAVRPSQTRKPQRNEAEKTTSGRIHREEDRGCGRNSVRVENRVSKF
jgi:hypothetical protein